MTASEKLRDAAAALHASRRSSGLLAPLPAALVPRDVAEGAAIQRAVAELRGDIPPAGFKIGATGSRMQAYLGLPGPAAGYMARIHAPDATFDWNTLYRPGMECELAVRLGRDLPPGPCSRAAAAAAVSALAAAIELVENRYADIAVLGTPTLVADQVYHHAAVIGPPVTDWDKLDPAALEGRILIDGEARDSGLGAELMGDPIGCLAWLAGSAVAASFGGLRAGQWVMLGSVTPPVWLDAPARVEVAFTHLPAVRLAVR